MKSNEYDERQKKAFRNIFNAANWIIGGFECDLLDNEEDSDEYKHAKEVLEDHEGLVNRIYEASISEIYNGGSVRFDESAKRDIKDIRFCGKEWLVARVDARVKKMGY